jgi:chromosome segregation ATPase
MSIENNEINVMDEINIKNNLINYMDAEIKRLKAELKTAQEGIDDLNDVLKDMQKESIEQIKDNKKLQDKLQAVNDDYNNDHKVHNEYEDGLLKEIEELKAEVKRGEEQYHMLASSKSKGIPKEYKAEAEEYFEHNNHCQEVMFFMLDNTLFDDNDDFDDFINKDDAICVINNKEVIA